MISINTHTIYLAGGCFWGVEGYFKRIPGVLLTTVGYANGATEHPTYEEVCINNTGHAETVCITYDPGALSLSAILCAFFEVVDPTSINRQGGDRGVQYRSGIYYTDKADLPIILDIVKKEQLKYTAPIVTEVLPLQNFYSAEEYHQDYLDKNPNGYCHIDLHAADRFIKED